MTLAKRSPDGFVAQRMPHDVNGHGHWVLTGWDDETGQLTVRVLSDEAVATWPALRDELDSP